jgi:hypothetical protein
MGEFHGDLDYLIHINVREEAYLHMLMIDHLQEWPDVAEEVARTRLKAKLVGLLQSEKIAIYAELWAKPETQRSLSIPEAVAAVEDDVNWRPPDKMEWFHYVYAADKDYLTWRSA